MKITLAHPYTDKAGKQHKPGDSTDLPEDEARRVIDTGFGRDTAADKAADKKEK